MTDKEYLVVRTRVHAKLGHIIESNYGPAQTTDYLKECIKLLKPFADKQEGKTHA